MAIWRRPKLTARGDPDHDHVVAGIVARLLELPRRAVVLAEDETHLNLLPHVRASWTLRGSAPGGPHPGEEPQGHRVRRARGDHRGVGVPAGPPLRGGLHRAAGPAARGVPAGPGDRGDLRQRQHPPRPQGHRATWSKHPRLELLYGARYSPHDNPAERIWGALKNYVANTAVSWPGRLRQIHSFFRARSPDQMLATAAPWTSPWLPPGYEQNFWNAA